MSPEEHIEQSPRDRLIDRVRKLQRMTLERGASETEATLAMEMVRKLIAEHSLTMSELSVRADAKACLKDEYICIRSTKPNWTKVAQGISRLYGTIAYWSESHEDILGLGFSTTTYSVVFYGFPTDVAASLATMAICAQAIDRAIANLGRTKKADRESFEYGMIIRLIERLDEMKARGIEEARGQGALVVLKESLIKEEFSKLGIGLRNTAARERPLNAAAVTRGRAAANGIALDCSVGAQAQGRLS